MVVTFTRSGKTFSGKVLDRGYYKVDAPESFYVQVAAHAAVWVPVSECKAA